MADVRANKGSAVARATVRGERHRRSAAAGIAAVLLVPGVVLTAPTPVAAADSDVVISEIHYKPVNGTDEEFVELTNAGDASVDVSGWCFTDGFEFCFPASTTIGAGERSVVTGSLADFEATYAFAADFEIVSGGISNGGETIELSNALGDVVDSVSYDDEGEWPAAPDGNGPSLELTDVLGDNDDPAIWGASLVTGGTPGAVNSIDGGIPGPEISATTATPFRPNPDQPIQLDATVTGATEVDLEFVVNFDEPQVIPMVAGVADNYTATIPGQAPGDLVRYRVLATDGSSPVTDPAATDTIDYHGVVVSDPEVSSAAPIIEWFIDEADYVDMLTNHRYDNVTFPAVFSHDGVVIDNATIRVRGAGTRDNPKPNFKVEFPDGHLFFVPGSMEYPVDEFNMQWNASGRAIAGWEAATQSGNPDVEIFTISTQRNGAFWGTGMYIEPLDGRWRTNNGYDSGALYKASTQAFLRPEPTPADLEEHFEKRTRDDEDYTDLWELTEALALPTGPEQLDYLLDNVDIPSVVNYMALRVIMRQYDARGHNYYIYRDTEGTGRWELLLWDLDDVFKDPALDTQATLLRPSEYGNELEKALLDYPEFEAMMFRRVRTLADEFVYSDVLDDVFHAVDDPIAEEIDASVKLWRWGQKTPKRTEVFERGLDARRSLIDQMTRSVGPPSNGQPIPRTQTTERPIVITEIHHDPSGSGVEFVEIANTSTTESFDLTGWTLDGVGGFEVPEGTILLPGAEVVFVADDVAFREFYPAAHVGGEFTGSLSDAGELLELFDADGALVDEVDYQSDAPWPDVRTTGRSLSLSDPAIDNDDPANWGVSLDDGGSPGRPNVLDPDPPMAPSADGVVLLNEWNAVGDDRTLKDDGSDPTFGQVDGNGGDWFELVVADDGIDIAGWELHWSEAGGPSSGVLTLVDDPLWASLPAGTIITVSEDQPDDVSFDPVGGDWSINVQAPGAYVTGEPFDVTNDDWQLTVVDDAGIVSFGPAGEGISTGGVGSTEVGALLDDPSSSTTADADYDDIVESTWGMPNPNGSGGVQDFSVLRNLVAPTVVSGPVDAVAREGDDVVFEVVAAGTSPLTYEWRRDGVPIPNSDMAAITVDNVSLADDGAVFDVAITNAFGSVVSDPASLAILLTPPRISDGLTGLWTFADGGGDTVSDTSGFGDPLPLTIADESMVTWLPEGGISVTGPVDISSVVSADKIVDASEATDEITLEAWIDPDDVSGNTGNRIAGVMGPSSRSIALSHGFYGEPSSSVEVRLRTAGSYGNKLGAGADSIDGRLVHLAVTRSSDGNETIYIDGEVAATRSTSGELTWTQQLPFMVAGDGRAGSGFTGDVFLVATYDQALSSADIAQNIEAGPFGTPPEPVAPSITSDPQDLTVTVGATATFSVAVSGVPAPQLQWRRDGVDLVGETGPTLRVVAVGLSDDGAVFDVVATNESGSTTSTPAVLAVQEATGITVEGDPTVTVVERAGSLDVTWEPVDGASLYQLRYRPAGSTRTWQSPTTDMASMLGDLESGVVYTVEVRAYTGAWGPFTAVVATPF